MNPLDFILGRSESNGRAVNGMILPKQVLDSSQKEKGIRPREDYFSIRLLEMHLEDSTVMWQEYHPIVVTLSRFRFDGAECEMPFVISGDLLKPVSELITGDAIGMYDVNVLGPIPYGGEAVHLFTGLYAVKKQDLVEQLLDSLSGVFRTLQSETVAAHLNLAQALYKDIQKLMLIEKQAFKCGDYREFNAIQGDHAQFRSGYLVYMISRDQTLDINNLWVQNGRLYRGETEDGLSRVNDSDYCLIKIDSSSERADFGNLPFHKIWQEVQTLIQGGQLEEAHLRFLGLMQALPRSPDITPTDRFNLVKTYTYLYEQEQEVLNLTMSLPGSAKPATRSGRRDAAPIGPAFFEKAASVARHAGLPDETQDTLLSLRDGWEPGAGEDGAHRGEGESDFAEVLGRVRKEDVPTPPDVDVGHLATAIQYTVVENLL